MTHWKGWKGKTINGRKEEQKNNNRKTGKEKVRQKETRKDR